MCSLNARVLRHRILPNVISWAAACERSYRPQTLSQVSSPHGVDVRLSSPASDRRKGRGPGLFLSEPQVLLPLCSANQLSTSHRATSLLGCRVHSFYADRIPVIRGTGNHRHLHAVQS